MSDNQHAVFSPSKLPRIIQCPGSVQITDGMTQGEQSSFAKEGTFLHSVVEDYLTRDEYQVTTRLDEDDEKNRDYVDAVNTVLDHCFTVKAALGDQEYLEHIEHTVSLKGFAEAYDNALLCDVAGTCDWSLAYGRTLRITDWKFGKGVIVNPDSDQLRAYAAGALKNPEYASQFDKVICVIGQPRVGDEAFSQVEYAVSDILRWVKHVLSPALLKTKAVPPILSPSPSACRWCLAGLTCRARHENAHKVAAEIFKAATALPDKVTPEEIAKILDMIPTWDTYVKDITNFAFREITSARTIPGYKVVQGKSNRAWVNPEVAKDVLEEQGYDVSELSEVKFFGPAAVEKEIGKKNLKGADWFTELIHKPKGKLTLTTESDPRPAAVIQSPEEIFTDFVSDDDAE